MYLFLSILCFSVTNIHFVSSNSNCGIRANTNVGKIVGGRPASRDEYPWTVALQELQFDTYTHFCGASVISDRWIVTAAHCLRNKNISKIRGIFGAINLEEKNDNVFKTSFIVSRIHDGFNHRTFENDIALLKTKDRIPRYSERKNINRICLPQSNEEFSGRVYVSGWGRVEEEEETSDVLKVLAVNMYHDSDCISLYKERFKPLQMLCAGYIKGTEDSCEGDSGGPLEKVVNGRATLVGIVSFGEGCGRELYPGVYTEVSQYVTWIQGIIGNDDNTDTDTKPEDKDDKFPINRNEHQFRVINRCQFTVWMSMLGNWGKTTPANGGFELKSDAQRSFSVDKHWVGRFWGRTGCENGFCETGDCGRGRGGCQGAGGKPPATLIEMVMDVDTGLDVYSISLQDGFNLPISIKPIADTFRYTSNSQYDCKPAGCYKDINKNCPSDLAVKVNGRVVACKSACFAKQHDSFCCRNEFLSEQNCLKAYSKTNYLTAFNDKCPQARTILYDTHKSTFRCTSDPVTNYEIVFCPTA